MFLQMTCKEFMYESAKVKAEYDLCRKKEEKNDLCDDIAELELVIRKIELKEEEDQLDKKP